MTSDRGYAWHRLPCGHDLAWDERLGPVPPCRECDAAGFRSWVVECGVVERMVDR